MWNLLLTRLTSLLFCRVTHSFFSKLWYSKWHKILLTFSKIKIEIINFSSVDLTSRLLIVCLTHLTLLTYDPIPTYQSLGSGAESHPIPLLFYWLHLTFVNSLFDTLDSVNISCSYIILESGAEPHPIPLLFCWLYLTFVNSLFHTLDSLDSVSNPIPRYQLWEVELSMFVKQRSLFDTLDSVNISCS